MPNAKNVHCSRRDHGGRRWWHSSAAVASRSTYENLFHLQTYYNYIRIVSVCVCGATRILVGDHLNVVVRTLGRKIISGTREQPLRIHRHSFNFIWHTRYTRSLKWRTHTWIRIIMRITTSIEWCRIGAITSRCIRIWVSFKSTKVRENTNETVLGWTHKFPIVWMQ